MRGHQGRAKNCRVTLKRAANRSPLSNGVTDLDQEWEFLIWIKDGAGACVYGKNA